MANEASRDAPQPARYPTKLRVQHTRRRTGCLTCRLRKRKCDEVKPICGGCTRSRLHCSWPTPPVVVPKKGTEGGGTQILADQAVGRITISWSASLQSFISPVRAAMMMPNTGLLLQNYLVEIGPNLVPVPLKRNPFLSIVMPLAYIDDLVMQCVAAMGGANLCFKNANNIDLQTSTAAHYSCIVSNLRVALVGLSMKETNKVLRILLVLIMVANFEAFSGRCYNGEIFPHLRASRQLILWLLEDHHYPTNADDRQLLGFLLESYAYLLLINAFCPLGAIPSRNIPFDSFLTDLSTLGKYPTFGIFFDGLHGLLEIIPEVALFASQRLEEEAAGSISAENNSRYERLHTRITGWRLTERAAKTDNSDETEDPAKVAHERKAVAECYRHALLAYLETAIAGSLVQDPLSSAKIERHVQMVGGHVLNAKLDSSRYTAIIMWPLVVAGSCLINEDQRDLLSRVLRDSKYSTWISVRAATLLQMLWQDEDAKAFGPNGLAVVMRKQGINFCMA